MGKLEHGIIRETLNRSETSTSAPCLTSRDGSRRHRWRIGLVQRCEGDRFLRDNETERDIFDELVDILTYSDAFSIERASFDELSVAEQAQFMHSHDIIVAAHGAALTNMIFMRSEFESCGVRIRPALIEVGFRFGWCADRVESDLQNGNSSESESESVNATVSNALLLRRWSQCSNRYYEKAEFFALFYAFSKRRDRRYIEVNAERYGDETGTDFLSKASLFVDLDFLMGELLNLYEDNEYDFEEQLERYRDSVYLKSALCSRAQDGICFLRCACFRERSLL